MFGLDPGTTEKMWEQYEKSFKLNVELPKLKTLKTIAIQGWRKATEPLLGELLGEIEYDARLEGFGWVEVLVKEKIPMPDGRLAMAWAVLPVAIKGPKTRSRGATTAGNRGGGCRMTQ